MIETPGWTSRIIHRAIDWRAFRLAKTAEARQWLSRNEIDRVSLRRLYDLLVHSIENVPYYSQHLAFKRNSIDAENLFEVFNTIPLLDKEIIRTQKQELIAKNFDLSKSKENASGGSTGKPVSFVTDMQLYTVMSAQMMVFFSWAGWKPGETMFCFWGGGDSTRSLNWLQHLKRNVKKQYIFPVYFYDEKIFGEWWENLRQYRPKIIYAYPSVFADFSSWLLQRGYEYAGLKGVFTSAEVLYEQQRAIIEKAFSCKVFNQYGCREAPAIACQCPAGNMHIINDLNYVEFISDDESEGTREIVVTPFFNYAQPLLRYRLMDYGSPVAGTCPCGRGYPLMAMEIGRRNDQMISHSGTRIFSSFFLHLLDGESWIKTYQFCQKNIDLIELRIEPETQVRTEEHIAKLQERILPVIKEKMGGRLELRIITVSEIERTAAGKHRFVISELENANA